MTKPIEFHIDEPWFEHIVEGRKVVEGKLAKGKALQMQVESILHISGNNGDVIECHITAIRPYSSFREYLESETLAKTLPGVTTIDAGLEVYQKYYEPGLDSKLGVLAIELQFIHFVKKQ
jgi:ASC-1-like (ASCH) protein